MQIYATATSPLVTGIGVGTGASKYTDIVTRCLNTLASGSNASVTDQLNAYQTLQSLSFSDLNSDGYSILAQTNMNDAKRAAAALGTAPIAQQMALVSGQIGAFLSPEAANSGQNMLDALSRFSQDDQQIIFASTGLNVRGADGQYFATLDDWKANLKQQSATFVAQQQASAAAASAATASSGAPALTTAPIAAIAARPANPAGATSLTAAGAPLTTASIALQVLLSDHAETHADARSAADAAVKTGTTSNSNHNGPGITMARDATASASALSSGHLNQLA